MHPDHPEMTSTRLLSPGETAEQLLDRVLNDEQHPVVVFTREGCEFCWAVKKFFASIELPYRIVELDSEDFQGKAYHHEIRSALQARSGSHTVPQIYISGHFIGGATDSFKAWKDGSLQHALKQSSVPFKESVGLDPNQFLSGWLHAF